MLSVLKKHTILYVEDEPDIQSNIAEYLENYFGTIILSSDGKEALNQYSKHAPDVVLLDINLPIIDGLSVAKDIRKTDTHTKIIMLTAFTEKEQLLKATELKLIKYLVKPVSPKIFKETLITLAEELVNNPSRYIKLSDHLVWNVEQEQLSQDGIFVSLAVKEQRLLKLFVQSRDKFVSYNSIVGAVWNNPIDRDISIDSIKKQVSQLRKKVPDIDISSSYGEGYILKLNHINPKSNNNA